MHRGYSKASPAAARYLRFQLHAAAQPRRAPLLERLLARADEAGVTSDWRADAFRIIAPGTPMPALAAAAYRAAGGPRHEGSVFLATPVHYLAEISNVRLAAESLLALDAAEAAALASDFNRVWRDSGVDLWASSNRLFCGFDAAVRASTQDPELARGRHLAAFLPTGSDAARLRRLMSEMEMWLFDHAVNGARRRRGEPQLSAIWLWGGGAPLSSLPEVQGCAAGGDVFFAAFAPAAAAPVAPAPGAAAPAAAAPDAGRCADVMVVDAAPGAPEWTDIQARWLAPTLVDLRRGRLEQLELSAGERRYIIRARWRRRFWRRAKPWWEYFE